jgi:hypothetical protein
LQSLYIKYRQISVENKLKSLNNETVWYSLKIAEGRKNKYDSNNAKRKYEVITLFEKIALTINKNNINGTNI